MSFRPAVDTLGVVVTADCNLRCAYCFQDRKQPQRIPWRTLSAAVDLVLASRRRVALSFLGGEPLLHFALIARAVRRATRRHGPRRRIPFVLTTNGLLLSERRVVFFARHRFKVQISFDGIPPSQALRAPGSFSVLDRLLDRLRQRHREFFRRRVSIAVTLSAPAIPYLANSFEYLLEKGVSEIDIVPAMGHPRLSDAEEADLDRQLARIFRRSLRHYRATGQVPLALFRRQTRDPRKAEEVGFACAATTGNNLVVDVDGEVYPCALLIRSCQRVARPALARRLAAMSLGSVTDPRGLADRLAKLPAAAKAAGIFAPQFGKRSGFGRCAACRHARVCLVCPVACAKNPDSADANRIPDFQCAFNRIAFDYRRRFPIQGVPGRQAPAWSFRSSTRRS